MSTLFISHSSRNNEQAVRVRDWLTAQGWTEIFLDFDPQAGIVPGRRWREELKKAGARCSAILVLISQEWLASKECWDEFRLASELGKEIFPCLITPCLPEDLPEELRAYQFADISTADREAGGLERLRIGLHRAGLTPDSFRWPPADEPTRPFYPGLRALEEQDAAIFFGRDLQITKALDCIRRMRDGAPERMLVILGASGAGKSSFLKAGLLARLQRDTLRFHTLPCLRPSRSPLTGPAGLQHILGMDLPLDTASVLTRLSQLRNTAMEERRRYLADHEAGASLAPPTIILSIDQAEELFTAATDDDAEAATVITLLAEIVERDPNLLILATIRSDSFNLLQNEQKLAAIPKLPFDLPKMPQPALKEIIEGPAKLVELKIDADLTEQLLQDFSGADALPLLACTLERLFVDYGDDDRLEKQEYLEKMKGVGGAILRSVEIAFAHALEHRDLPDSREELDKIAQRCFVPGLVRIDDPAAAPKRRVMLRRDLPPEAQALIDCFIEQRLLVVDEEKAGPTVEVAHEAILHHWPDLAAWIAERRDDLFRAEGVMAAARDWREAPEATRNESLVHRGERLQAAEQLLLWEDVKKLLGDAGIAYLSACRDEETRIGVTAAAQERRQRRFRQWITGLVVAGAVVTVVGAALVVMGQRNLGRAQSLTLARTAERLADEGNYLHALRISILATQNNWLLPPAPEAWSALSSYSQTQKLLKEYRGHDSGVKGAFFFMEDAKILTWSDDKTARIWDANTGEQIGLPLKHDGRINGVLLSKDETRILTWSADKTARIWDASTNELIKLLVNPEIGVHGEINGALFSKDETCVLTWSDDYTARIWNASNGTQIGKPLKHDDEINGALFSKDGTHILTWSDDRTARIWNASNGTQIGKPLKHKSAVSGALFSKDGSRILTWSWDKTLRIWDILTCRQIGPTINHPDSVDGALFSKDENRILAWSHMVDNTISLWDTRNGKRTIPLMKHDKGIAGALFSEDETFILSWSKQDNTARLWQANVGRQLGPPMKHEKGVNGALFSKDGTRILTWSDDNTARLWQANAGDQLGPPMKHEKGVNGALFSEDGARILTWSDDNTAQIWNTDTGAKIGTSFRHNDSVRGAYFSKDETQIITWSRDNSVKIWEIKTGNNITLPHKYNICAVKNDIETSLLTYNFDTNFQLWNIKTGKQTEQFIMPYGTLVYDAFLSNDKSRIITWSNDNLVRILDTKTGKIIGPQFISLNGFRDSYFTQKESNFIVCEYDYSKNYIFNFFDSNFYKNYKVTFKEKDEEVIVGKYLSSDKSLVVTFNKKNNVLYIYDMKNENKTIASISNNKKIYEVHFFDKETKIVTLSNDYSARIFDINTGNAIGDSLNHNDKIVGVIFKDDKSRIITLSRDDDVRIWDSLTGKQIGLPFKIYYRADNVLFSWNYKYFLTSSSESNSVDLWDVQWAMRNPKHPSFIPDLCREKLVGESVKKQSADGRQVLVGIRHIDEIDVKAAPILRGREGEDVCAPPPTTWQTMLTLIRGH